MTRNAIGSASQAMVSNLLFIFLLLGLRRELATRFQDSQAPQLLDMVQEESANIDMSSAVILSGHGRGTRTRQRCRVGGEDA